MPGTPIGGYGNKSPNALNPKKTVKNPPTVITSPPKGHTNPGSRGAKSTTMKVASDKNNAAKTAAAKAAAANAATIVSVATTPTAAALTPEDQALQQVSVPSSPGYGGVSSGGTDLASKFDPASYASSMAGMQYDPQITQLATRIKGIINALPGSLNSLHTAFSNLDARNAAPPISAAGPSTTGAANAYGAQLASINNSAAANQAQGASSREADWATRIRLMSDANVNDMRGQLGGLQGAKGEAQVGFYNQGIKTKSDLVSQAISNINSIRASNAAQAMVEGNLAQQGQKTIGMQLQNAGLAAQNQYQPYVNAQNLDQGAQTIAQNDISLTVAKNNLKQLPGTQKNLATALSSGGPTAVDSLNSLIFPKGSVVQTATGYTHIMGDPNQWVKNGVAQIMRTLPKSNRTNVTKYVQQQIANQLNTAGGWKQVNGKWKRPK